MLSFEVVRLLMSALNLSDHWPEASGTSSCEYVPRWLVSLRIELWHPGDPPFERDRTSAAGRFTLMFGDGSPELVMNSRASEFEG